MANTSTNLMTHADLAELVTLRSKAEWAEWDGFATLADREEATVLASETPGLVKQVELSAVPGEIGRAVHWSEAQVSNRVAQARRVRDHTPSVWAAFEAGRIDGSKAREISSAIEKLERSASIARLDRQVVAYAETHTMPELRRWLRLFIARAEADLFTERAAEGRANRGVSILHGDDGMSQLIADLPSTWVGAIDKRLTKAALAFGADDSRTLAQRKADLVAAWLTTNETGEAAVNADIAVTLPASALTGVDDQPAVAADGNWVVPATWIRELADHAGNNLFWHRMVLDPVTDDVLAHEYKGRFAPDILTKALEFRDGVCQAPGCSKPAHLCDIDHRIPHQTGGPTAAWNLGPYCRKHHKLKGFGLIDTGPTTQGPPGRPRNTPLWSVGLPHIPAEQRIRHLLNTKIDWTWNDAA